MAARQAPPVPGEGKALTPAALRPLGRRFFERDSPVVARDLLGRLLVRHIDGATMIGRIVECEAYREDDPASHSYRGRTPRTDVMFGRPGRLYVYFTYGMHYCMNVVTGREGEGSAVLLRAVEPIRGLEPMRRNRAGAPDELLCSGPARLTQAFAIGRGHNGLDLVTAGDLFVGRGKALPEGAVATAPRIGITAARDRPWRFLDATSRFVSRASAPRLD